mmetsp:Transcript_47165/g.111202  ORF Transcript_47165/g.111202 Transcript_47165/m.111202 type:complete len:573 (-) Transcript_47165:126-1844(-)
MSGIMLAGLRGRMATAVLLAAFFVGSSAQRNNYMEGSYRRIGGGLVTGTPPASSSFTLECSNPTSPSSPSTCVFPWPTARPTWCEAGYHCFAVVTPQEQGAPVFRHSESLQSAINERSVSVKVVRAQGLEEPTDGSGPLTLTIYNLKVESFVDDDDLHVCFSAGGLEERCVTYVLARKPDWMRVRTEGGTDFVPMLTTAGYMYQSTLLYVRAHDFNRRDTVLIDLVADHNGTTASPTSNLIFTDARSDLNLQAAAFRWLGPPMCVDPDAVPGFCPSGVWERIGALKPKFFGLTYNATFGARDDPRDEVLATATRAEAAIVTNTRAPSWLDDITSNRGGVPVGSPLQGQFIGAADVATDQVGSVLTRARAFVNCGISATLYALAGTETETVANVALVSERPFGMVISMEQERVAPGMVGVNKGNNGLLGQMVMRTDVRWTPQLGQEGAEYTVCMEATMAASPTANRRCFVIAVARCRYCAAQGDTLGSIARQFHTTWLQLWAANDSPSFQVTPGTLLVLGPTYSTKPLDSLDSLATRLHTDVDKLLMLNPDIKDPTAIDVGHEICFVPDICPA